MELPDLGANCGYKPCNRLDFLPMKCDACGLNLCNNHLFYDAHECVKAHEKNVKVPVCPLCKEPVPLKKGQSPDERVSQHIDNDCNDLRSSNKRKPFDANRCKMKGCRVREMIPFTCSDCTISFCLKHRHPLDHECKPVQRPMDLVPSAMKTGFSSGAMKASAAAGMSRMNRLFSQMMPTTSNPSTPTMDEDEQLARAIQASMMDTTGTSTSPSPLHQPGTADQEERMLREAIAASLRQTHAGSSTRSHKDCVIQ